MAAGAEAWPGWRPANALRGLLIYGGGDAAAALILGEFSLARLAAVAFMGASLYALEVPNWFHLIERRVPARAGFAGSLVRTALALVYFNPLWIARHLLVIALAGGEAVGWGLLSTATRSFLANIPLALVANWLIQNAVPERRRFSASALYSALMAVYYAFCRAWFG